MFYFRFLALKLHCIVILNMYKYMKSSYRHLSQPLTHEQYESYHLLLQSVITAVHVLCFLQAVLSG